MANTNISTLTDMTTGLVVFDITPNTPLKSDSNFGQVGSGGSFTNQNSAVTSNLSLTDPFNQGDRILFVMAAHPYGSANNSSVDHGLQSPPTFGGTALNEFITGNTTDSSAISNGFGSADNTTGRRYNGTELGGWHNTNFRSQWSLWYLKNPSLTANTTLSFTSRYFQNNSERNYGYIGFVMYTGVNQTDTFVEMERIWDSTNSNMQIKYYKQLSSSTAASNHGGTTAANSAGWTPSTPGNLMVTCLDQNSRYCTGINTNPTSFDYTLSDGTNHRYQTDFSGYYSQSYANSSGVGNTSAGIGSKIGHVSPSEYMSVSPGGTSSYASGSPYVWQLNTSDPDPILTVPDGYTARIHDMYVTSIDIDGFQFDLQVSGLAATGASPATLLNSSGVSTMTIGSTNVSTLADGYIFRGKKLHLNQFSDGRIKLLPDGKNLWLAAGDQLKMKMYHENRDKSYMHYKARVNMQVEMIKST